MGVLDLGLLAVLFELEAIDSEQLQHEVAKLDHIRRRKLSAITEVRNQTLGRGRAGETMAIDKQVEHTVAAHKGEARIVARSTSGALVQTARGCCKVKMNRLAWIFPHRCIGAEPFRPMPAR